MTFSSMLRMGIIYQSAMYYFAPKWMLHHLFGWSSGLMAGTTAVLLTAYVAQKAAILISRGIQSYKSYRLKRRIEKRNAAPVTSRALIIHEWPRLTRIPVIRLPMFIGINPEDEFLIQLRDLFLYIVANKFSTKKLHKLATTIPGLGWLYEYTHLRRESNLDDFFYAILRGRFDRVREMLKVIPGTSLNKMLARTHKEGYTPLLYVAGLLRNEELLRVMLAPLTDEQKILHFMNKTTVLGKEMTLLERIDRRLYGYKNHRKIWGVIKRSLSEENYFKLITSLNSKGESILHRTVVAHYPKYTETILKGLSHDHIKRALLNNCQHEMSPLISLFLDSDSDDMKCVLRLLPKTEWEIILHTKLENSSMTVGEKSLVASLAYKAHLGYSVDITNFARKYRVQLPEPYASLSYLDLKETLRQLWAIYTKGNCESKHRFVEQYGRTPERILGHEPLMPPRTYLNAYKELAKAYHPDKNHTESAHRKTVEINGANEYLNKNGYMHYKNAR